MAGQPGRSGGARPGAGRPKGSKNAKPRAKPGPKPSADPPAPEDGAAVTPNALKPADDPLDFLLGVMNNLAADPRLRVRAAIAAVQYKHTKRGDGGKRDEVADKAKKAGAGRFAPPKPPLKLVGNSGA